jgi:general secretion pathway protein F
MQADREMRKVDLGRLHALIFGPSYEQLARFAGNLSTCLAAGLGVPQGLKMGRRAFGNTYLGTQFDIVQERVEEGTGLTEAMADLGKYLPPFFLAVIWAGERTGRLAEALEYLREHCQSLAGPARTLRNTWLVPLCLMLAGTIIKLFAHLFLDTLAGSLVFLWESLVSYAFLAAIVVLLIAPPLQPLWSMLRLRLPIIGTVERELAANRFFRVFGMLYCSAGHRVEKMIQLAAETVSNVAMRRDLLKTVAPIKRGASIADAFDAPSELTRGQKDAIAAGDLAGKLEEALDRLSAEAGESLRAKLHAFQQVFFRIMMAIVVISILQTMYHLLLMRLQR